MKIGFFTENYYKGGLDTFLVNLFNAWPEEKDELVLLCNSTHPGIETIKAKVGRQFSVSEYRRIFTSNIAVGRSPFHLMRSYPVRVFFILAYRVLQYPILFPWYVFSLALFFRRCDLDRLLVVNGGYPASLLCRCAVIAWRLSGRRPLAALNFHNSTTKAPWYFSFAEYLIDLAVIWAAKEFVSVSRDCLGSLNTRRAFCGYKKLNYIYNGISEPLLGNGKEKIESNPEAASYCLMLATYEPRKGHSHLLSAFQQVVKKFPNLRLRIYGYGTPMEMQRVADEVKNHSLENNVILNGFTPKTGYLIANAKALVVPSQAHESFGLTIVEAMAYGIPVVTTDVGGMPEVLADTEAGFVCPRKDFIAFAEAIEKIVGDPALAVKLGKNGRMAFEQKFRAEIMARKYMALLN